MIRFPLVFVFLASVPAAGAMPIALPASQRDGSPMSRTGLQAGSETFKVWTTGPATAPLTFASKTQKFTVTGGCVYLQVAYLDAGYGLIDVQLQDQSGRKIKPDRFLGLTMADSGALVRARMRFTGVAARDTGGISFGVAVSKPDKPLAVESVILQDVPFDDPNFSYAISDPWLQAYKGPSVAPADNLTLKGKVMVGYQGWFRTPNDPDARGWVHWGDIPKGFFSVDMWPDTSDYPKEVLEKACDVKLGSGKQAYLFSSAWPAVVDTHFKWMREHDIDGAFLQRFVNDRFCSISGKPERVLANVRAAANREGRIWAIEYDVSGYSDKKLLETMKTDWKWLVDVFKLLEDKNYAREGGKPVVFIWGLPFENRNYTPETADKVVDFFKNDPQYGGNHVIGGIPGNWRKMAPAWQRHIARYHCVLPWMSSSYEQDIADFKKIGLSYYAHVKPGFSWANLKHLPTGDNTISFTPRQRGSYYWNQLTKVANSGAERLFVGMFDEYDEGTAIMPMSDDTPPTPSRPGVSATFFKGERAGESGTNVRLDRAELDLGNPPPARGIPEDHYFVRLGGVIGLPAPGAYRFSIEGVSGDDVRIIVAGKTLIDLKKFPGRAISKEVHVAGAAGPVPYRIEYAHRTGSGKLRLLWQTPGAKPAPVPAKSLRDAWGRFINNEGRPSDWWLELTGKGKRLMNGNLETHPGSNLQSNPH
jgi:hypothetical protein